MTPLKRKIQPFKKVNFGRSKTTHSHSSLVTTHNTAGTLEPTLQHAFTPTCRVPAHDSRRLRRAARGSESAQGLVSIRAWFGQCQDLVSYTNSHSGGDSGALESHKDSAWPQGASMSRMCPSSRIIMEEGHSWQARSLAFQKQSRVIS